MDPRLVPRAWPLRNALYPVAGNGLCQAAARRAPGAGTRRGDAVSRREPTTLDMTLAEQEHVQNALYFLRAKFGSWKPVAQMLRYEQQTLVQSANGTRGVAAAMAFRVARAVGIGIDVLLAGGFPEPGVCPRCAYRVPVTGSYRPTKRVSSG